MPDLEDITKEALYTQIVDLQGQVQTLEFQLSQANRLLFGQTRERFVPTEQAQQTSLFDQERMDKPVENSLGEEQAVVVKKKGQIAGKPNVNHNGRNEFPAHLPRVVEILTPSAGRRPGA